MVWEGTVTCEYYDPASLAMATGLQGLWTWISWMLLNAFE